MQHSSCGKSILYTYCISLISYPPCQTWQSPYSFSITQKQLHLSLPTSIQMLSALNIFRQMLSDIFLSVSSVNLHRTIATGKELQSMEKQFVFVTEIREYACIREGFALYCTKNTSVPMFLHFSYTNQYILYIYVFIYQIKVYMYK